MPWECRLLNLSFDSHKAIFQFRRTEVYKPYLVTIPGGTCRYSLVFWVSAVFWYVLQLLKVVYSGELEPSFTLTVQTLLDTYLLLVLKAYKQLDAPNNNGLSLTPLVTSTT